MGCGEASSGDPPPADPADGIESDRSNDAGDPDVAANIRLQLGEEDSEEEQQPKASDELEQLPRLRSLFGLNWLALAHESPPSEKNANRTRR